jgi:hypothetical protein
MGIRPAGVFRGAGYKKGKWLDVGWWQLELQPEQSDPPEPRAFHFLRDSSPVTAALRNSLGFLTATITTS